MTVQAILFKRNKFNFKECKRYCTFIKKNICRLGQLIIIVFVLLNPIIQNSFIVLKRHKNGNIDYIIEISK